MMILYDALWYTTDMNVYNKYDAMTRVSCLFVKFMNVHAHSAIVTPYDVLDLC